MMNIVEELQSLDINDVGRWPLVFRAGVIAIVFVAVVGLGIFSYGVTSGSGSMRPPGLAFTALMYSSKSSISPAQPPSTMPDAASAIRTILLMDETSIFYCASSSR